MGSPVNHLVLVTIGRPGETPGCGVGGSRASEDPAEEDCIYETSRKGDAGLSRAQLEATCKEATVKTLDLYPSLAPRRVVPN
jgi:hypothetical protein